MKPLPKAGAATAVPAGGSKGEENRKEIDAFFNGPVPTLSFEIEPQQLERLKRDERKYVKATMNDGDRMYKNVALKLKGSHGSFQHIGGKPGLTLNFDKFKGAKRYHGMKRFHLNNAVQDPTYLNELMSGEIARKAGVPASRCTHALVRLNDRDLGLYVLKEGYTEDFLAEFYRDTGGDLYEGGPGDISEKTEKDQGDVKDTTDLKALIAACGEVDDTKRWEKLDAILDIEQFINYLAVENIVAHRDGYSYNRNNYRFYKDPATSKFSFILDGMDRTLAPADFALQRNVAGMVSRAVMHTARAKPMYLARVESVLNNVLKPIDWVARVEVVGNNVRDALAVEHADRAKKFEESIKIAKERVAARIRGVEKQLAAISKPVQFGEKGD
jgi:spore coat protein CotH